MTPFARFFSAALLGVVLLPSARATQIVVPAPSTWTLNVGQSDFGGVPGMKSDVMRVLISNEKRFKYTDVMVLSSGQTVPNRWDGPQDGTLKPSPGWPGVKLGYNFVDGTSHAEMPDGSKMDGVISLAPDGKTLTFKVEIRAKDGAVAHQTLVYERTK